MLYFVYGVAGEPVDNVLYDGIQESSFSTSDAAQVSNDNNVCIGPEEGTMANFNAEALSSFPAIEEFYRPASPFEPYNCSEMTGGPIDLPDLGD